MSTAILLAGKKISSVFGPFIHLPHPPGEYCIITSRLERESILSMVWDGGNRYWSCVETTWNRPSIHCPWFDSEFWPHLHSLSMVWQWSLSLCVRLSGHHRWQWHEQISEGIAYFCFFKEFLCEHFRFGQSCSLCYCKFKLSTFILPSALHRPYN